MFLAAIGHYSRNGVDKMRKWLFCVREGSSKRDGIEALTVYKEPQEQNRTLDASFDYIIFDSAAHLVAEKKLTTVLTA